jgi:hypothetical protein
MEVVAAVAAVVAVGGGGDALVGDLDVRVLLCLDHAWRTYMALDLFLYDSYRFAL